MRIQIIFDRVSKTGKWWRWNRMRIQIIFDLEKGGEASKQWGAKAATSKPSESWESWKWTVIAHAGKMESWLSDNDDDERLSRYCNICVYSKITPPIYHSMKSSHVKWPMSQVATCDRGGVTDTCMWHFVCTFLSKFDEVSRIIIRYEMGKTDKN